MGLGETESNDMRNGVNGLAISSLHRERQNRIQRGTSQKRHHKAVKPERDAGTTGEAAREELPVAGVHVVADKRTRFLRRGLALEKTAHAVRVGFLGKAVVNT